MAPLNLKMLLKKDFDVNAHKTCIILMALEMGDDTEKS